MIECPTCQWNTKECCGAPVQTNLADTEPVETEPVWWVVTESFHGQQTKESAEIDGNREPGTIYVVWEAWDYNNYEELEPC